MRKLIVVFSVALLALVVFFCRYFVFRALDAHGHPVSQITEINQLAEALYGCKAIHIQFPPCLAETDPAARKRSFMKYLDVAYPNAEYGTDVADFDALNRKVQTDWGYNYRAGNQLLVPLDLGHLDAAESLVFWIGGFPTPYDSAEGTNIAPTKLFGFHKDQNDPFKNKMDRVSVVDPMRFRSMHDHNTFHQDRLVDHDDDGWWEYVMQQPENGEMYAPIVYFDAATILAAGKSRETLGGYRYPPSPSLAALWGTASPYAVNFDSASPERTVWANDNSFQLISAGRDGKYGSPGNGSDLPPRRVTVLKPGLPSFTFVDGFQKARPADRAEEDNLTNLSFRRLGDAAKSGKWELEQPR